MTESHAEKNCINIDPSCSDDFIQAQLLKCMFILRHRQINRNYDNSVSKSKWTVFWEIISQYSLSAVNNQYEKSFDFLADSLLGYEEPVSWSDYETSSNSRNWRPRRQGVIKTIDWTGSISNSEWLPLHCCASSSAVSDEHTKVLSLACIKSGGNRVNDYQLLKTKETPLHLAVVLKNPNMKTIKHLLKYFPRMTSVETDMGELPLHLAARYSNNIEVIELLIKAYPHGLMKKCFSGEVPLFKACHNRTENSPQIIQKLLQASPHSVQSINNLGCNPLHVTVSRFHYPCSSSSILVEIIQTLLTAYPDGVSIPDSYGNTLLHLHLVYEHFNITEIHSAVELLLRAYPTAASVLNYQQQTPLHYLLRQPHAGRKNLNTIVTMLLDVYPEAVTVRDEHGCYPIHYAVRNDLNLSIIERIIDGHPDALLALGTPLSFDFEVTPIQVSLKYSHEANVRDKLALMKYLFSRCPESIHIRSEDNDTVLHIAVKYCNDSKKDEIVEAVYHMDPSAAMSTDNFSGETPLYEAIRNVLSNYITPHFGSNHYFRFLIRKCPGAVTMINSRGMSPLEEVARYRKKNINDDRGHMLHRMLLQSVPGANPQELYRLNYMARRMAMFMFFTAISDDSNEDDCDDNIFTKIRIFDIHIVHRVVMFL